MHLPTGQICFLFHCDKLQVAMRYSVRGKLSRSVEEAMSALGVLPQQFSC